MASPQVEDGFTKIANELLEALARIRIPGEARQVLDVIIRKTYGFRKKEDAISLSQFCLATGLKKSNCVRAIKKALAMNLIIRTDNGNISLYRVNKNFEAWKLLSARITLSKRIINVIREDNKSLSARSTTKEIKETIQKKYTESFLIFWTAYPKKENKIAASKAWEKLKPSNGDIEAIMLALEKHKHTEQWQNDKGKFIPHAARWINGRRWEDEIETLQKKYSWMEA